MVFACWQLGASIAANARAHDINGNVLHRWVREHLLLGAQYADHLPLYRHKQIFVRAGVALARSALAQWG